MSLTRSLLLVLGAAALASACSTVPAYLRAPNGAKGSAPTSASLAALPAPLGRCSSLHAGHPTPREPGRGDRVVLAIADDRSLAYVANEDDAAVHTIDLRSGKEIAVTALAGAPSSLVALRDGRIVASLRDQNQIVVLEPDESPESALVARCTAPVPSEPVGLAASETGGEAERIIVTSGFGHALTTFRESDLERALSVDLRRDPRAALVHGSKVFVSHMSSAELDVVDLATGALSKVDVLAAQKPLGVARKTRDDGSPEPDKIHGGQVFALASSEGRLFVPMVAVDPGEPKISGAYGSAEVPIKPFVGVVDLEATHELRIDVPSQTGATHRACTLPRSAAAASGGRLFVVCAGIDELLELDGRADNAIHAIRRRVHVPSGPLGLAIDDEDAVVFSQFDHQVSIVALSGNREMVRVALSRRAAPVDEAFERGRKIFHDSFDLRVSADGRACASCHPDGRDDGNTWSTPDGPRQTIPLAGRVADSGPYGWFGKHATLDSHLTETMHRLGGAGFTSKHDREDLAALETYLQKMKAPVASVVDEERVRVGRALFHDEKQGCGTCHAEGSTDRDRHDVGTGHPEEASVQFDTPSLAFISASAPYFHDGRYATLDDLLAKSDDRMGHAKHLDAEQRSSLVAYMESLAPRPDPSPDTRSASFAPASALGPIDPDAASTREQQSLAALPPPRVLASVDFDLSALPVVAISQPIRWDEKSPEAQGTELSKDEIVWSHGCAAIPHHAAAHLKLDWVSTSMTSKLERCIFAPSPDGMRHWSEVSTATIDPLPNGDLHVVTREGFLRLGSKEIRIAREIAVDAKPIDGGVMFAYRTTCDDCKEGRDQLHVVFPGEAESVFEMAALSLERGHVSHSGAVVMPWYLPGWTKATGAHVDNASPIGDPRAIVLGVDASRTESEDEARVALGRGACRSDSSSSCF